MASILVTGSAGFIGSHVSAALLARGDRVVGIDELNAFYDPRLKEENLAPLLEFKHFTFFRGSLLDDTIVQAALREGPFDAVVHLAAWAGVRPSIERPAHYQRENVEATTLLLDTVRQMKSPLPRFVFASSSSVYGGNTVVPFHEDHDVSRPVSPYAASKRAGELIVATFHHLYGIESSSLRFFTVYGPRQRPEMAIHMFGRRILDDQVIPMFGDGSSSRDYTYIDDITDGVVAAVDKTRGCRIYNLGNSHPVRLDDLIARIGRALGKTPRVERKPFALGDVEITYADVSRAQKELGYAPKIDIDEGLARFAAWLKTR
jgi:UDP-glucuronate 4-epimerase